MGQYGPLSILPHIMVHFPRIVGNMDTSGEIMFSPRSHLLSNAVSFLMMRDADNIQVLPYTGFEISSSATLDYITGFP